MQISRVTNQSNTNFKACIVIADKNKELMKNVIKLGAEQNPSFLCDLDKLKRVYPQAVLLADIEEKAESCFTHEITLTNLYNNQTQKIGWADTRHYLRNTFSQLIRQILNFTFCIEFWEAPPVKREKAPLGVLDHDIFFEEKDFDYDEYQIACERAEKEENFVEDLKKLKEEQYHLKNRSDLLSRSVLTGTPEPKYDITREKLYDKYLRSVPKIRTLDDYHTYCMKQYDETRRRACFLPEEDK